jgi:hypothetical protein
MSEISRVLEWVEAHSPFRKTHYHIQLTEEELKVVLSRLNHPSDSAIRESIEAQTR